MKLYIVRHAQSKRNIRVHSDEDVELTPVGEEQAKRLGSHFNDKKLDFVYCSTLKRAKATLGKMKLSLNGIPLKYTNKIDEYKMGIYSKNGSDDWDAFSRDVKKKGVPFENFKPKGGESLLECYHRAGKFYSYLLKKHKKKNILMVGHGIFSLYLILNTLGLPTTEGAYYQLSNASVSTLNIEGNKVKDFHINDYNQLIREAMKK